MIYENRPTPPHVQEELRKEAGFGCCGCGNPVYKYHHIIPWHVENHFRVCDMMILCPNHHDEADCGAMTEKKQRKYKALPHNIKHGFAKGLLTVNQPESAIVIGSSRFIKNGVVIQIDDCDILRISKNPNGEVELSLYLYDKNDIQLVCVEKNEWISGDFFPWDIKSGYRFLKIRQKKGFVNVDINCSDDIIKIKGNIYYKGNSVFMSNKFTIVNAVLAKNIKIIGGTWNGFGIKIWSDRERITIG